jgi:glycosyltransferase involved in cell wall biosynthesis
MARSAPLPSSLHTPVRRAGDHPQHRARPAASAGPAPDALTGISIVLPCHDDADHVEEAINAALIAGARCAAAYEVIVVDDGSGDATATIAAAHAVRDRHVRVICHAAHRGYGDAVRSGVAAATLEWVFLTAPDLPFDLGELEELLPRAQAADLIAGWRILSRDPLHRRMSAAAWNRLVGVAFHLPLRDVDCPFKLVRRDVVQGCELHCSGAMINTELMVTAHAHGARLLEHGVHHLPRVAGRSPADRPHVALHDVVELAALHRAQRRADRPRRTPAAA